MSAKDLGPIEPVKGRTFYRLVGETTYTEIDLASEAKKAERGLLDYDFKDLGGNVEPYEWQGVSVFNDLKKARQHALRMYRFRKPIGRYIVEIEIPADSEIGGQRSQPPYGHYNLFAAGAVLYSYHHRVVASLSDEEIANAEAAAQEATK